MSADDLWVGGLGWPYDDLLAASLRGRGHQASALGPLDHDAFERGTAALPRGQCAPALFTTGALLRRASAPDAGDGGRYLRLHSCGPCRYALFGLGYERALRVAGHTDVRLLDLDPSPRALLAMWGEDGSRLGVDALLVGDALAEGLRRLRPRVRDIEALEARAQVVCAELVAALEAGHDGCDALRVRADWAADLARLPDAPRPRVVLVGEPFSLHVDGPAQLNLPQVLAAAGAEIRVPPVALWLAYQLWIERQPAFGQSQPVAAARVAEVASLEAALRSRFDEMMAAFGVADHFLPDVDHLAELAAPHLPGSWRAGYGHVEVGLALAAAEDGHAHLVVSIKSFGCLPSSSVADAILPAALLGKLAFLSLEVAGDGEAARESRLALRLDAARRLAEDQASRALP